MAPRRFAPPQSVEDIGAAFVVMDSMGLTAQRNWAGGNAHSMSMRHLFF
jgi:hypothetical protein